MISTSAHSRILLVEHDPIPALDRRHFLETSGYAVVRVEDGNAALELVDRGEVFSAAIIDSELSGDLNAVDTVAALRQRRDIPVLILGEAPVEDGFSNTEGHESFMYAPRSDSDALLPLLREAGVHPSRRRDRGRVSGPEYGAYFYETIIRTISDVVAVLDDEGVVRYKSPSIETEFGHKPNEAIGVPALDFVHPEDRDAVGMLVQRILDNPDRKEVIEFRYVLPDGDFVWVEGRVTGYSDARIQKGLIVSYCDISKRVRAREALEAALREKELLISEVHHRVKNDLNLVHSMLSLQAGRSSSEETARALNDASERIGVMSQIYEQLYRGELTGVVDLKSVISRLIDDIRRAGVRSNVHIQVDVYSVTLSARLALAAGLIINEIVTNSLKYADPEGSSLDITGTVGPTPDGNTLRIAIQDSGRGFPDELLNRRGEGFGFTIVRALTEQYNGTVELKNDSGAFVQVFLPLSGDGN